MAYPGRRIGLQRRRNASNSAMISTGVGAFCSYKVSNSSNPPCPLPEFVEQTPGWRRSQPEHRLGLKAAEMRTARLLVEILLSCSATRLRPPETAGRSRRGQKTPTMDILTIRDNPLPLLQYQFFGDMRSERPAKNREPGRVSRFPGFESVGLICARPEHTITQ